MRERLQPVLMTEIKNLIGKWWIMAERNSRILKTKVITFRKFFVLSLISAILFTGSQFSYGSDISGSLINLGRLNFLYPADGSIKIELVSDNPVTNYQIRTIANKAIIQIKGVRSALYSSYLVRNSFDVEVQTTVKEFDGAAGVELVIVMPQGVTAVPINEPNKLCFLVSLNKESKPEEAQQAKPSGDAKSNEIHFNSQKTEISRLATRLERLNFHYLDDGSIRVELASDSSVSNYQIRTIGNKTIIQIPGAISALYPSYLVRNAFDVEVQTAVKEFDDRSGVELSIIAPPGASVIPKTEFNKASFLVSVKTDAKPGGNSQPAKAKSVGAPNVQPVANTAEISFVPKRILVEQRV